MEDHSPSITQGSGCKVAVITATYNAAKHIQACMASVESQTYHDTCHVIIDSKSDDDTVAIIQRSSSKKLIYLSERDGGIYSAWNKGVKLVNADWYLFLGSDDILLPSAIEDLVRQVYCCTDVNLVSAVSMLLQPNGQFAGLFGSAFSRRFLWHHMPNSNCSTIYHRTLLSDDLAFNEGLRSAADYAFLMRMRHSIRSSHSPVVVSAMRLGGISNNSPMLSIRESFREKLKYYPRYSHFFLLLFYWISIMKYDLKRIVFKV